MHMWLIYTCVYVMLNIPEVSPDLEMIERELSDQSHYSDENDFSDKQKTSILSLLNSLSIEEACAIPGCSETKATLLLADRPFKSWENLVMLYVSFWSIGRFPASESVCGCD